MPRVDLNFFDENGANPSLRVRGNRTDGPIRSCFVRAIHPSNIPGPARARTHPDDDPSSCKTSDTCLLCSSSQEVAVNGNLFLSFEGMAFDKYTHILQRFAHETEYDPRATLVREKTEFADGLMQLDFEHADEAVAWASSMLAMVKSSLGTGAAFLIFDKLEQCVKVSACRGPSTSPARCQRSIGSLTFVARRTLAPSRPST